MQYNIFFGFPTLPKIEYGVDKTFVEKIVNGYLRGQLSVIIAGQSIKISETRLQIYAIPKELAGERTNIEKFFTKEIKRLNRGIISEKVLVYHCKNVTNAFLLDRGWADLKEDVYNVLIKTDHEKFVKSVVEKGDLLTMIDCWQKGLLKGILSGTVISLENLLSISIYDIKIKHRKKNVGETKKHVNEHLRIHFNNKWIVPALEEFGKDVTATFKIGAYGSNHKITEPIKSAIPESPKIQRGKFFISHSSKDKIIVNKFVNEILILSLGTENSKIFCTSIEGLDINSGEDFRQRIKKELIEAQIVLQIISKDYKSSEVCLNEMGAAWVLAEKVIPLLVDDVYDVGFIHNSTQQLKLNKKTDILKLIDDLEHYCPNKSKGAKIEGHIEEFLKQINGKPSQTS